MHAAETHTKFFGLETDPDFEKTFRADLAAAGVKLKGGKLEQMLSLFTTMSVALPDIVSKKNIQAGFAKNHDITTHTIRVNPGRILAHIPAACDMTPEDMNHLLNDTIPKCTALVKDKGYMYRI